ncbi:MAG TPA: SWIB/MDM2 domain-containing protein [Planctomycetota bacterium]|nr:SWIB/MDM2 domain-containing protein [Planctomycetota bacterium]
MSGHSASGCARGASPTPLSRREPMAKKANSAFMKPLTPSASLADIVGAKPLPRSEVVKKMWVYIKKNGLQDKTNKRMINSDAKLGAVFGGKKQVSMFEMNKHLAKHLK